MRGRNSYVRGNEKKEGVPREVQKTDGGGDIEETLKEKVVKRMWKKTTTEERT
jgi:hypothetical protein